ncbi:MAG: addiction module protein [Verrucomicrobia bacterium]|nr:addiction module protein [Verrucomicrobiota bacterium]
MNAELPLAQMTVAEKLRAMEALWADLSTQAADDAVPAWHAQVLAERERRLAAGQERVLDWDEAKRQLRRELHEGPDS